MKKKVDFKYIQPWLLLSLLISGLLFFGFTSMESEKRVNEITEPTPREMQLYNLLMEYRQQMGLPKIPISKSLTYVAQSHVKDLQNNYVYGPNCNMHSWSDKGRWKACCYSASHSNPRCMWDKPREMTSYQGDGFEITYWFSGTVTSQKALDAWKKSPGHNQTIVNQGMWRNDTWNAIGIGMSQNYAVVWFGKIKEED